MGKETHNILHELFREQRAGGGKVWRGEGSDDIIVRRTSRESESVKLVVLRKVIDGLPFYLTEGFKQLLVVQSMLEVDFLTEGVRVLVRKKRVKRILRWFECF